MSECTCIDRSDCGICCRLTSWENELDKSIDGYKTVCSEGIIIRNVIELSNTCRVRFKP